MTPLTTSPHDLQSVGIGVTLVATLCVVYWRLAVRLVIIAAVALTLCGLIMLVEVLQHLTR
jgi:hypothetical protein